MATLAPTTELEAVNTLLSTIGEAPVSTLVGVQAADVLMAQAVLLEVSRAVQSLGWHCNTEEEFPLVPDENNNLQFPTNALHLDPSAVRYAQGEYDLVQRGGKLYDRLNHTFEFTNTVYVDITFFLAFEDLPEAFRRYITIKAARIFADRAVGAETMHTYTLRDEQEAWVALKHAEADTADLNILKQALKFWRRR